MYFALILYDVQIRDVSAGRDEYSLTGYIHPSELIFSSACPFKPKLIFILFTLKNDDLHEETLCAHVSPRKSKLSPFRDEGAKPSIKKRFALIIVSTIV